MAYRADQGTTRVPNNTATPESKVLYNADIGIVPDMPRTGLCRVHCLKH